MEWALLNGGGQQCGRFVFSSRGAVRNVSEGLEGLVPLFLWCLPYVTIPMAGIPLFADRVICI